MYKAGHFRRPCLLAVLSLTLLLASASLLSAADFQIIVNSANPVTSLSNRQVSDFFMKKTTKWDSGTEAAPVDQAAASEVRESFSKAILDRTANQVVSFWQQSLFSGQGVPPPTKNSDSEVVGFVSSNPGAIGYVSAAAALTGVKAVQVSP